MTSIMGFYSRKRSPDFLKKLDNAVKEGYYYMKDFLMKKGWNLYYHDGWAIYTEKGREIFKLGVKNPETILKERVWDTFNLKEKIFFSAILTIGNAPKEGADNSLGSWDYIYGGEKWILPSDAGNDITTTNKGNLGKDIMSKLKNQNYVKDALPGHVLSNWVKKELKSNSEKLFSLAKKEKIINKIEWFEDTPFMYLIGTNKGIIAGNRDRRVNLFYYRDNQVFVVSSVKESIEKICKIMNFEKNKIKELNYREEILFE